MHHYLFNGNDMNSGYSGYSMSNRAVEAYECGEKPISKWTKTELIYAVEDIVKELQSEDIQIKFSIPVLKKAPAAVIKDLVLFKTSWHHTSSFANSTDFYTVDETLIKNLTDEQIYAAVAEHKKPKPPVEKIQYKGCIVYVTWEGTGKWRKSTKHILENVNIEERGSFYIVTDDNGQELIRKKIWSNGTHVVNYKREEEKRIAKEKEEERIRSISSSAAWDFWLTIRDSDYTTSYSGHIYKRGRKPSPADYERGVEHYFEVGERRLFRDADKGLHLEEWDGTQWIQESEENANKQEGPSGDKMTYIDFVLDALHESIKEKE